MNLRDTLDREQRLAICQLLEQDPAYSHNEHVIKRALEMLAHNLSSDLVRNHLSWLAEQGLVTLDRESVPAAWVVKLTQRGHDAALGCSAIPGISRPRP